MTCAVTPVCWVTHHASVPRLTRSWDIAKPRESQADWDWLDTCWLGFFSREGQRVERRDLTKEDESGRDKVGL